LDKPQAVNKRRWNTHCATSHQFNGIKIQEFHGLSQFHRQIQLQIENILKALKFWERHKNYLLIKIDYNRQIIYIYTLLDAFIVLKSVQPTTIKKIAGTNLRR
jgi:hypothetical protein